MKGTTFTAKYAAADGFLVLGEWRRDSSNQPYFLTNTLGVLKEQNTATLGLVWWFGGKQGSR